MYTLKNLNLGEEVIVGADLNETKRLYQLDGGGFMLRMRGKKFKIADLSHSTKGDDKITLKCTENGGHYHFAYSDVRKVVDIEEDEKILKLRNENPVFFDPQNLVRR